jgi:hypothetical protein
MKVLFVLLDLHRLLCALLYLWCPVFDELFDEHANGCAAGYPVSNTVCENWSGGAHGM